MPPPLQNKKLIYIAKMAPSRVKHKMVTSYILNLDLPPHERFAELLAAFDVTELRAEFNTVYDSLVPHIPLINGGMDVLSRMHANKIMFCDEITFWANALLIPFHKVLLMQLIYEFNAGCTTVVAPLDGKQVMIRTMDWPMEYLKKVTYHGIFTKGGRVVFEGVCWLGSVGLFTGKNRHYSVAINYRRTHAVSIATILGNYLNAIHAHWPVSYLVRYALENEWQYDTTHKILADAPLIAPVYYVLNNYAGAPCVLMRDPDNCTRVTGKCVIQTNSDDNRHGENIMMSFERFAMADDILRTHHTKSAVLERMRKYPVINEDTIYYAVMGEDMFEIATV